MPLIGVDVGGEMVFSNQVSLINCVDMCVFLIVFVDIVKLLCRSVLLHFIFLIVVFGGLVENKSRRIFVGKFPTALTSTWPGMACDRVPAIIRIG